MICIKTKFIQLLLLFLISISLIKAFDGIPKESTYCATWSSSQYLTASNNLPPIPLSNNSIRQIVHISVSSPTIRLKLSNRVGKSDLEINAVSLANSVSQGSGEIDPLTLTTVTFDRKESVVIPAGSEMYSDPFYYPLKVQSEVAISIYFGEVPSELTSHAGSRTFSFIEKGNKISKTKFSDEFKTAHWYIIEAIEVSSSPTKKVVVCYGDSITDGRGSTDDKQNRCTDVLSRKLYLNDATKNVACVNAGIGATFVRNEGQERFERDVLNVKGSAYIIVLYGVNDILFTGSSSEQVIEAYKALITKAHQNKKFIYGATILPFGKNDNWSKEKDKVRNEVNEWIRNTDKDEGGFDYYFDFDEIIKDPKNGSNLYDEYDCGDGLHLSPKGYETLVDSIDNLKLFTLNYKKEDEDEKEEEEQEKEEEKEKDKDKDKDGVNLTNKVGIKFELDEELKKEDEITISIRGKCEDDSYGFRVLTNDNDEKKTSDYHYTGRLEKGSFEFSVIFQVYNNSKWVVIRRPISTMNLDKIIIYSVEVETNSGKKKFNAKKDGLILY